MECVTQDGAVEVTLPRGNDCGAVPQNLGNGHGVSTTVTAGRPRSGPLNETVLDALSCAVAASEAESNTAAGNTDTLASCACTTPPCGLEAATFKTALQEVVTTGRLHHHICPTNLSVTLCSVEEG